MKSNGSPLPEFETDDNHSYFISRFFIHEAFLNEIAGASENVVSGVADSLVIEYGDLKVKSGGINNGATSNVSVLLNVKQENIKKILLAIQENPRITIMRIVEKTGIFLYCQKYFLYIFLFYV